mmetsp:Transcript_25978/g.61643  ORF Transcript_25978/g.61643 Transcript_25978/m.61643 type:complete len:150 (+) Transcript_25978:434-883(+)|eukprot:CAMPEP_0113457896 /NCGR_PEP_ID=MMETSP0014_2-20120614/9643_1 /TAXON_ID=2857 /ORGANISM="Nitzschia sp." /LENGTH=149 /DNA_ID=CAMNT_0000349403 /DNA_START=145 /DNA_END=594 /DNA_ORIENTATION=+ /assembly_acc=CAM_ASM_000159
MVKFAGVPEGSHEKQTTLKKDDLELHLVANADDFLQRYALAYSVKHLSNYTLRVEEVPAGEGEDGPSAKLVLSGTHVVDDKPFSIKWRLDPTKVVWTAGVSAQMDQATHMLLIYLPKVHGTGDDIPIHVQADLAKTQDEEAEMEGSFSS